ncbi:MAG: molybdenum cofactor guanylyltransferase [Luteitalea sp.]
MSGYPDGADVAWTGVVLAGGGSRRFGGVAKTRLPVCGRTLVQWSLDALAPITTARLLVGGRWSAHEHGGDVRHLPDCYPDAGPLGGLLTALEAIDTSHALVVAADLPFISRRLLVEVQRAGAQAVVACVQHPDGRFALCLSVRRDAAPEVARGWARGDRRIRDLLQLAPCRLVAADPATAMCALWNVNDPLTYARALVMAEHDCPASYFTDPTESNR